mgnify:FL=1
MNSKKLFLLLFIVPLFAFTAHKYYLSLTQIEFNSKNKSIEIIINVFIDDFETALNKIHSKDFQLNTKKEITDTDTYFYQYLKDKVQFKVNGNTVKYNYIGKEYDGDVVFFYLEITDIDKVKEIEIDNSILIQHFPSQQNLVKSKVNKNHKSVLLTKSNQNGKLKY